MMPTRAGPIDRSLGLRQRRALASRAPRAGRLAWPLALLCALWLVHAAAWAQMAAKVGFVTGQVTASAAGASARALVKGSDVNSGDRVDTAQNGRIQMRFTDGGLVSLMPGTTFSVDEYLRQGRAGESGSLVFGLLRGGLRTITGTIGKIRHEDYQLRTPVATLGIRGTEFIAVLNPPNTLRVHVGRGKVVLTNEAGSLEVPQGSNAVVTLGAAPQLTDQPPRYLATSPGGDSARPQGEIDSDPFLDSPLRDLPTPGGFLPPDLPLPGPGGPGSGPGTSGGGSPTGPGSGSF